MVAPFEPLRQKLLRLKAAVAAIPTGEIAALGMHIQARGGSASAALRDRRRPRRPSLPGSPGEAAPPRSGAREPVAPWVRARGRPRSAPS